MSQQHANSSYGFAAPDAHAMYDDYPHHRHPYHASPSPRPDGSPNLGSPGHPYLDIEEKSGAPLSPLSPASSTMALHPDFHHDTYNRSSSKGRESTEPSYPSYAHYEIPDRSTTNLARSRSIASSREITDPMDLKEGDIPPGWTKEDEEAEREFLKAGLFNWRELSDWRFWIRLEWWYWYVAFIICGVMVILMTVYHDQIVGWLTPAANWMKALPAGWTIPIAILFVISFPPLFGHEIVAIICGIVWGLWIGFGIVAAGTFFGEVANYWAFKYCCRSRAQKYENKNINYACLSYVMREGGFFIVFMARLSAIPGHFTTAVFATCGMNVWVFLIATFLTLPKQLITVYLGVLIHQREGTSTKNRIVSYTVLAIGFLVTIYAAWYIYHQMHKVRVIVWRRLRMQMAARGIALGEVGYSRDPESGEIDASTPILQTHPHRQTQGGLAVPGGRDERSSYINPYNIRYDREGDMSVYHVDAMTERVNLEEDIADRMRRHQPPVPALPEQYRTQGHGGLGQGVHGGHGGSGRAGVEQGDAFPQAAPSGVKREPSSASAFHQLGKPQPQAIPSAFPVAAPIAPPGGEGPYDRYGGQV